MIKLLFITAIIIIAGLGAAQFFINDPGYLLINYNELLIETSLVVVFVGFILLTLCVLGLLIIIKSFIKPVQWIKNKNTQPAVDPKLNKGLLALADGHWADAEQSLGKVSKKSPYYLVASLGAARAAHEQRKNRISLKYLNTAQKQLMYTNPHAKHHIALLKSQFAYDQGDYQTCLDHLNNLSSEEHSELYLKLKIRTLAKLEQWHQVFALLPDIRKADILHNDELVVLEGAAFKHVCQDQNFETITGYWNEFPNNRQEEDDIALVYYQALLENNEKEQAEKIAKLQIQRGVSTRWVQEYAKLNHINWQTRYNMIQKYFGNLHDDLIVQKTLKALELEGKRAETQSEIEQQAKNAQKDS